MGKSARRKKRIQALADAVLATEVKRTARNLPSMLPDSALFASPDSAPPKKKKKIILRPPPQTPAFEKTADVEYCDIWSKPTASPAAMPRPPSMNRKPRPPTSDEAREKKSEITERKENRKKETMVI
jgi:hypothetical protein